LLLDDAIEDLDDVRDERITVGDEEHGEIAGVDRSQTREQSV
jgi:hypothetical protein